MLWWSFYEAEASFDSFLPNALEYLGRRGIVGPRLQADALLDALRQPGVLLVLDGFERELRAFSGMGAAYQGDDEQAPDAFSPDVRACVRLVAEFFLRALAACAPSPRCPTSRARC